ncbi:Collagenase-like protease, PrtC family [Cohaesibacter sp. ES.047]|uniref:ubiquinone anaerobic biosynthesis protein UbiV n=1 Tax=Cohaesibacter sp. ES.047 TaxID=1798205 RepID=UPI000BB8089C|nr:U32 family peptidase [Cohaesibacter sp. ES.047]SNY93889.1 Collagenase-like protease, PrtC family [Cohaesibacter sp. ES.047]
MNTAELTLGPCLFNWSEDDWRDFYFRMADEADLDLIYVGEAVCSKRLPFRNKILPEVLERLESAGKKVILSTLALVTTKPERKALQEQCEQDLLTVEANDLTALAFLKNRPFVVGPYVNIYNEATIKSLTDRGATRFVLPPEVPAETAAELIRHAPEPTYEIQVFGRLPLALSARCYHARLHHLSKDSCRFVCDQDPDGRAVNSLAGQPFLAVNGIQTMSYGVQLLLEELSTLAESGIGAFRLSPHTGDMVAVAKIFRAVMNTDMEPAEARAKIAELMPEHSFVNGYIHGQPGMHQITEALTLSAH